MGNSIEVKVEESKLKGKLQYTSPRMSVPYSIQVKEKGLSKPTGLLNIISDNYLLPA